MSDDHDNPFSGFPLSKEQFAEFLHAHMQGHKRQEDMVETRANAFQLEKTNFISGLTAEQLGTLVKLLPLAGSDPIVAAHLTGEVAAVLKYVHKVDPATGEDPFAVLLNSGHHHDGEGH